MVMVTMTSQEFAKLMEDFAEATKNKEYKRLNYNNWRELQPSTKSEEIYLSLSQRKWRITYPGGTLYIPCDDMSFGAFLSNRLANTCYFEEYDNNNNNTNEEKKKTMKLFDNFDFGPVDGDKVRMSAYGMAIKNAAGTWVAYDAKNKNIMDVEIFNFDGSKFMYKMPVAVNAVAVGDIVIHMKKPAYVMEVKANSFMVIDAYDGSIKEILPTHSPFGFAFIVKVMNLFDTMAAPNADNPFGNMWMLALMSNDTNCDMKDMMMLSMLSSKNSGIGNFNPMMLMLLANEDKNNWMIPLMLMNNGLMSAPQISQPITGQN